MNQMTETSTAREGSPVVSSENKKPLFQLSEESRKKVLEEVKKSPLRVAKQTVHITDELKRAGLNFKQILTYINETVAETEGYEGIRLTMRQIVDAYFEKYPEQKPAPKTAKPKR